MEVVRVIGCIKTSQPDSQVDYELDLDKAEWDRRDDRGRRYMIVQNVLYAGHLIHTYTTEVVDV